MGDKVVIRLEIDDSGSIRALQENARGVEALGDSVAASAAKMTRAVEGVAQTTTKFSTIWGAGLPDTVKNASRGVDTLVTAVSAAGAAHTAASRGVTTLVEAVTHAGRQATAAGRSFEQMSLGLLAANQAIEYFDSIADRAAGTLDRFIEAGVELDAVLHKIKGRTGETTEGIHAIAEELDAVSVKFGKSAVELGQTTLALLSDGARDADEALTLLNQSMLLSKATGAELSTTSFALQRSMQAYGIETRNAAEFAKTLFVATDLGRDSFEEIATATLTTGSAVKQLGVNYKELFASTVALQQQGRNLGDITNGLSGIFDGLLKPSTELTKTFKALKVEGGEQLIEKFGGVVGALQAVRHEMDTNGEGFAKAFKSVNAYSIALDLVNATGRQVPGIMRQMEDGADSLTQRLNDQAGSVKSLDAQYAALKESFDGTVFQSMEKNVEDLKKLRNELFAVVVEAAKAHPEVLKVGVAAASLTGTVASTAAGVLQFSVMIGYLIINMRELAVATAGARTVLALLWSQILGPAVLVGAGVAAVALGVTALGRKLEESAGHAKTAEEAMDEYAKKTGMARKAVEDLNNTPPELYEAGFTQTTFDELKEKVTSALNAVREAVKDGNKEAARSMLDDLMREYGKTISKLPKAQQVTLFGRTVNVGSEASDFATWYKNQTGELDKTLPTPKAPPGDPKKWSDILSDVKEKYQGIVDAENALAEASARHLELLVNQKAPLTEVTAAVQKEVQHRVAALQATVTMNEALVSAAVAAKAPAAEITKYRAEVEAANMALRDQAIILDEIVNNLLAKMEERAQPRLAALAAEREARQAIYDLAVELHLPEEQILARAQQLQMATNNSAAAGVELAQSLYDAAKAAGASSDTLGELAAKLELARVKSGDMTKDIRAAHAAIKGMYEQVKIDLPSAFRQGMKDAFAAVVSGTRKMSDVWEGVKVSITGQFADAFAAIIFGKKKQFDDPMEKNLGGIAGLFGQTAASGQQSFGGLFSWIANGISRLFGGAGPAKQALVQGAQQFSQFSQQQQQLLGTSGFSFVSANAGNPVVRYGVTAPPVQQQQSWFGGLMSGFQSWFGNTFPNASKFFKNLPDTMSWLMGGPGKVISPGDMKPGQEAVVMPDGTLRQAPGAMASFSANYGALISGIGLVISQLTKNADYISSAEAQFVQLASQAIPVYGYLAYAIPVLNRMGDIMRGWIGLSSRNMGNRMAWSVMMNPADAFFMMADPPRSERDNARRSFGRSLGGILAPLHPELWAPSDKNQIVSREGGQLLTQRAFDGLSTGLAARVIALLYMGGMNSKAPIGGDPRNPQQGWLGTFNVISGQTQNLFDEFPDLADQFAREIITSLSGGMAAAIDAVQRSIMRMVRDLAGAKTGGTDLLTAYRRITGQGGEPFMSKQGLAFGGEDGLPFVPTMEQAVAEIVRVLSEDMPRAIRNNLDGIMEREFERVKESMSDEARERNGGIVTIEGKQVARALEIEGDAFAKLSGAFVEAGTEILKGATRREALDLFRSKLREAVTKAFAEGISKGFVSEVITDNLLAPLLSKLDRGLKMASEAESPKDALAIFNDLTLALGSDLKEMEAKIAAFGPLLDKYAKLQERIALAATSFDDIAKAAKELARSLRSSIAQFTTDLEEQQKLATQDSRRERRAAIAAIERRFGGTDLLDIVKADAKDLSDDNLKRMPDLLERARNAIVENAQLELDFLSRRLDLARQWASLKMPAEDALRVVREFGRQNTKPALSAFESGRSQMQQLLKDFRSEDEATRLAAAQGIVQLGPQLLDLARNAGFAPGSQVFEDLRSTLDSTLVKIQREAAAREVEALQLQRDIKGVQDKALEQLEALATIAKGVEMEARARQLALQEESINYDDLQYGELQTHTEALQGIFGLLNRGINVVEVAKGNKSAYEALPGLSAGGLVMGGARPFMLHPPELVVPLDRVGDVMGRARGRARGEGSILVQITQNIERGEKACDGSIEEEMLFLQQLRRAMRDPVIAEEIVRLARKAQQEA